MREDLHEFESLLEDLADGLPSDEQVRELRDSLRTSADARSRYVQWQMLNAALTMESGSLPIDDSGPPTVVPRSQVPRTQVPGNTLAAAAHRFTWTRALAIAASIAFFAIAIRWAYLELETDAEVAQQGNTGEVMIDQEPTSRGIALVTRLVDATWDDSRSAVEVGDALTPQRLNLKSGYAQIEFFCGASVVLEGPAELELISSTSASFMSGRLRAQVPPAARGFEINVDGMKVVDLGTEFGVSVSPEGSDVQVFDGEVELHRSNQKTQLVRAGQGYAHESGSLSETQIAPDDYVDLAALDDHARNQTDSRFSGWREYSRQLREDDRLIAYYAVDQTDRWQRKLQSSMIPENRELDGAIVGAQRVAGRWPGKGALEFKHPGDRVRVNIPGEFGSLTFACWVKIDSLDRWYNSLFLTDNYQRGEPHWQILDTGQLFFSVRVSRQQGGPQHKVALSPPFWNPTLSGKWLHLATAYDVDSKTTTHYLNGKLLSRESIPDHQLVETTRIGMASIGNWSVPTKPDEHFAIRNLNGCIDEFTIFSAALTADEIAEIYELGNP